MLRIALLTLGDPDKPSGGYLYHRRIADAAPANGAHIDFVSFAERPFPLPVLQAPAVLRQASRLDADVLVLDSIAAPFLGRWFLLRRAARQGTGLTLPLVGILHQPPGGIDHGKLGTLLQRQLDLQAYRQAGLLMVASQALLEEVADAGLPRARLRTVPPGRDVATRTGRPVTNIRRGRRVALLCVGHWLERKGIHSLLEALAQLPADAATLHLVGETGTPGGYSARLRSRMAERDLAGRVVVHGQLSTEDVATLYAAADIFVLPSLREPYGTVYGEAMAFGLPVVGWRAGNLPHLALDGREGLLVEPGNVAELGQALWRLVDDEYLRRRLGKNARRRAETFPTWEESARLFFESIREVVGVARGGSS